MKVSNILLGSLIVAYLVLWIGGIISYCFLGGPPEDAGWTPSTFLIIAALIVFVTAGSNDRLPLLGMAATGFLAEWIGLLTGWPFGSYVYTGVLVPTLVGVPVAIACAWMILGAYVKEMLRALSVAPVFGLLPGSVWMTAIDLVIDPLAAGPLGYWTWIGGGWYFGVPMTNFLGWLLVSAVALGVSRRPPARNRWARIIGLTVVLFFTIIAFATGFAVVGAIGTVLVILHIILLQAGGNGAR